MGLSDLVCLDDHILILHIQDNCYRFSYIQNYYPSKGSCFSEQKNIHKPPERGKQNLLGRTPRGLSDFFMHGI